MVKSNGLPLLFKSCLGFCAISVLSLAHISTAHAWGIGLDPIALPVNSKCSVTVLKGTDTGQFKGVAFVAPTVEISVDKFGDRLFDIIPGKNNKYILRVGFYIPSDPAEAMKYRSKGNSTLIGASTCSMDTIKKALEIHETTGHGKKNFGDLDTKTQNQIQSQISTLSMLPVQAMDVEITNGGTTDADKVNLITTIGKDSSIRNSTGNDWIAEFTIDADDREIIYNKLTDRIGLQFEIKLHFQAQSQTGAQTVQILTSDVVTAVKAGFKGNLAKTPLNFDSKAELTKIISSMHVKASIEGNSPDMAKFATDVIAQVTTALTNEAATVQSATTASPQAAVSDSTAAPQPATSGTTVGNSFSVDAFVKKLSKQTDFDVELKTSTGDMPVVASSNVILQAGEGSEGFRIYSNKPARVLPTTIRAGQDFNLNLTEYGTQAYKRMLTVDGSRHVLTREELLENKDIFSSGRSSALSKNSKADTFHEFFNVGALALQTATLSGHGHESAGPNDLAMYQGKKIDNSYADALYVWEVAETAPAYSAYTSTPQNLNICNMDGSFRFRFTKHPGAWFTVRDLISPSDKVWNKVFTATCDATGLSIHAIKDLGRISVNNGFVGSTTLRPSKWWLETSYNGTSSTGDVIHQSVISDESINVPDWVNSYKVDLQVEEGVTSFQEISATFKGGDQIVNIPNL